MRYNFMSFRFALLVCSAVVLTISSCKKEEVDLREPWSEAIDPIAAPAEFSKQLQVNGSLQQGAVSSGAISSQLSINSFQTSAVVTENNFLFIPIAVDNPTQVAGVQLQIQNADNFWQIPAQFQAVEPTVLKIGIPQRVKEGAFEIYYRLYGASGAVGPEKTLYTRIVASEPVCNSPSGSVTISGNDGISVRSFSLGGTSGQVSIAFDTYSVPDRIDIRYGGEWKYSTGALLDDGNSTPPLKSCDDVVAGDGFVGRTGTFVLDYDPEESRTIDVYVSGCMDGGTSWEVSVSCPSEGNGTLGQSSGNWKDYLPDCPCTYADALRLVEHPTDFGGWYDCGSADTDFHYGATNEVRWIPSGIGEAGQQCTYDEDGRLITSGLAAGTPDMVSPQACGKLHSIIGGAPGSIADVVRAASYHYELDVLTWEYGHRQSVSCVEYMQTWEPNAGSGCSNGVSVNDFTHMGNLVADLTCEEITLFFKVVDWNTEGNENLHQYIHRDLGWTPSTVELKGWLEDFRGGEYACGDDDPSSPIACVAVQKMIEKL